MNISCNGVSGREGAVTGGVAHGSHSNDKSRVVRALYNIVVELNDLLNPGDWKHVSFARSLVFERLACTYWEAQSVQ